MRKKIWSGKKIIITLTIMLLIFFIVDNILLSINRYTKNRMEEYVEARTYVVQSMYSVDDPERSEKIFDGFSEYLDANPGIQSYIKAYHVLGYRNLKIEEEEFQEYMGIYGGDFEGIREYIEPEGLSMPEGNEVLIPKYIFVNDIDLGGYLLSTEASKEKEYIDGSTLVGKTISGDLSSSWVVPDGAVFPERREVKVIGTYDNMAMVNSGGLLLINPETLLAWQMEAEIYNENEPDKNTIYGWSATEYSLEVITETRADLLALSNYVDELWEQNHELYGLCSAMLDERYLFSFSTMLLIGNIIIVFFLVNIAVNIVFTEENEIYIRRKEFGLMKAVGYKNSQIAMFHLKETAKNGLLVLVLAFTIGSAILFILNMIMVPMLNLLYHTFRLKVLGIVCLFSVLIVVVSLGIGYIIGIRRIFKLQAVEALKSEEG